MTITILVFFVLVAIMALFPPSSEQLQKVTFYLFGLFLIIFAAFSEGDVDYHNYLYWYKAIRSDTISITHEITFVLLSLISYTPLMLFLVYAILGVSLKLIALRQLTELTLLSLLLYVSYYFMLHEVIQIRAGIASAFLLLAIRPIYERNGKLFLLFVLLAYLFHRSSIIILPLWFLRDKPYKWILALAVPMAYLIHFSGLNLISVIPIPSIEQKFEAYQMLQKYGGEEWGDVNVFNLVYLSKIVIFYILLLKYDVVEQANRYTPILMQIYAISLFCLPALAVIPVMAFRVSELLGIVDIILIPLLAHVFKERQIGYALVVGIATTLFLISIYYNEFLDEVEFFTW